jgi:stearoyl-CoA desaturase (delta-9 desaturase)
VATKIDLESGEAATTADQPIMFAEDARLNPETQISDAATVPFGARLDKRAARAKLREHGILSTTKIGGSIAAVYWMVTYGSGWVEWSGFALGYFLSMMGCIIGYHRYFSHRAFETSYPMGIFIGILTQSAAQGSVLHWAANHRRHHAMTDKVGDAHSPHFDGYGKPLKGFAGFHHAHVGWLFDRTTTDLSIYGKGLVDDPVVMFCHRNRWTIYLFSAVLLPAAWALAFGGSVIGTILIAGLLRIFVVLTVLQSVNSIGHIFGSQRFDGHGTAKNNLIINILTMGDGWHNNHHQHPRSATAGVVWWEFDLFADIVRIWEKMGLVWNVKWAPRYTRNANGEWVQVKR